jgi:DivIVA domain-containing protein
MPSFPLAMRGYARQQVDELFARIDGTLGRGPATAQPVTPDVRAARFDTTMRGYVPKEVDKALNAAAQELEQQSN